MCGIALFGSELEHRAEYERVNIPGVVMRCIQEVDARGKSWYCTLLQGSTNMSLGRHGR